MSIKGRTVLPYGMLLLTIAAVTIANPDVAWAENLLTQPLEASHMHYDTSEKNVITITPEEHNRIAANLDNRGIDVMVSSTHRPNSHPAAAKYGSNIYAACEGIYSGYPCIDVYRSTDGGQSWPWVTGWYNASATYQVFFPSITVTSSYVFVTFDMRENGAVEDVLCARIPIGGTSIDYYTIDSQDRGTSDIDRWGDDLYCVYKYEYSSTDWDIEFKRSTNHGVTWSSRVTVAGLWPVSHPFEMPKINVIGGNTLLAAWHYWHSASSSYLVGYSKSTDYGNSWSGTASLSDSKYPDIATNGNTWLVVCQSHSDNRISYWFTYDAGSNWLLNQIQMNSYLPQCWYENGDWFAAYTRYNKVYCDNASGPSSLGSGIALTDGNTALNDAIGLVRIGDDQALCLWKDSRNSTSIYCDNNIIASITVTSPNGGECWIRGTSNYITWTSSNLTGNVKIELYEGGSYNSTIAPITSNDGSHNWVIPSNQTPGTDYTVRISSVDYPSVYDFSNGNFTIWRQIVVTAPNGGELWIIGTPHYITWITAGTAGNVKIEYSTDGGSTWNTETSGTYDDGSYLWIIPNTPTTQGKVKITRVTYGTNYDQSDGNFTMYTGISEQNQEIPTAFGLYQNSPNPVATHTVIRYAIHIPCRVTLKLFDCGGKEIADLVDEDKTPGYYTFLCNIGTISKEHLANGVYFYRLEARDFLDIKKMVILR